MHSPAAAAEMARLDWQAVANTTDVTLLENYLNRHPAAPYYDQGWRRLNDVIWGKSNHGDINDLRNYLQRFPSGTHADEARKDLAELEKPQPKDTAPPPPPEQPHPTSFIDDQTAIRELLQTYEKCYENQDAAGLQRIWPGMSNEQSRRTQDFFRTASSVRLSYILKANPKISGDHATLELKQEVSYAMDGSFQKPMTNKINMRLKKTGQGAWVIDSLQ
jgi:hypothetical protein